MKQLAQAVKRSIETDAYAQAECTLAEFSRFVVRMGCEYHRDGEDRYDVWSFGRTQTPWRLTVTIKEPKND